MNPLCFSRAAPFLFGALAALLAPIPAPAAEPPAAAATEENAAPAEAPRRPRYMLIGPDGKTVTNDQFYGRWQLISFGYTFCPDVCPTTLVEIAEVLKDLGADAQRVQAIFITVDPERDTPAVLNNYTQFFDPRILGLSGSPTMTRGVANQFRVRYEKVRDPSHPPDYYLVDHTAGIYLLDPDGALVKNFPYTQPPNEIAERLREFFSGKP
ncbi:MAG: SCO family protein [Betaproteobacteria bacterium]|nr:SCO family protein [Betaproteobacteria bacterium]